MANLKNCMSGRLWRFITSHWLSLSFLLSLVVRLSTIALEPYWYDEAFTAFAASLPFSNMLQAIAGDTHPPIWYALSWLLVQVGGAASPFLMRVPAAIFSALCTSELYKIVRSMVGQKEAMLASGLLVLLPGQIYYGQEARMYSLLSLLVLFGVNSVLSKNWLRVALSAVLMMYTHNMAILYAVPLGVWSVVSSRGKIARYWYLALAYIPWLGVLRQQVASMQDNGFWITNNTPGGMLYYLEYSTFFNRLPAWAHYHGAIAAIAITCIALWSLRRDLMSKTGILAGMGIIPSGELYTISQVWRPMMLDRLLVPAGIFIVAIWAIAYTKMSTLSRRVSLVIFVPLLALSLIGYYTTNYRTDYGLGLQPIRDNWQDGDTVYHNSLSSVVLLRGQLPDDGYIMPGLGDLSQSLSEPTKRAMGIKQRELTPGQLSAMGYRRLWVLYLSTPMTTQNEIDNIKGWIERYPVIDRYDVGRDQFVVFEVVLLDISHDKKAFSDLLRLPAPSAN